MQAQELYIRCLLSQQGNEIRLAFDSRMPTRVSASRRYYPRVKRHRSSDIRLVLQKNSVSGAVTWQPEPSRLFFRMLVAVMTGDGYMANVFLRHKLRQK